MSFMDKIKSFFSGGSAASSDATAPDPVADRTSAPMGEPAATPMPPADPAGMPTTDEPMADLGEEDADQPA
jgi:hypothetical protein